MIATLASALNALMDCRLRGNDSFFADPTAPHRLDFYLAFGRISFAVGKKWETFFEVQSEPFFCPKVSDHPEHCPGSLESALPSNMLRTRRDSSVGRALH